MANPAGLSYVKVVGTYQAFVGDSIDPDDLPDFVDYEGTGIITPNLIDAKNLNPGLTATYLPEPIVVTITAGVVTRSGNPYVMLLAPSAGVTPLFWNYSIKLSLRLAGSAPDTPYIAYGPFNFDPVPDPITGVVDLATATPVVSTAAVPMTAGAPGAPGDMVLVSPQANWTGAVALSTADLPSTMIRTLTGNVTLTLPTPGATRSGTISLILTQDATGNRTITWPANTILKWPDGISQQPAAAAGTVSMIHLLWTGSVWLGMLGGKSFA